MHGLVDIKTVKMTQWKSTAQAMVNEGLLGSLDQLSAESYIDNELNALVLKVRAALASEPLKEIHVKYPKDWWQAFKERWFPTWGKERWPVKYKEVVLEAKAVYPLISLPEEKHFVVLQRRELAINA